MVCFHLYFLVKALKKSIWMLVNPMDTLLQPTTLQWSSLTNVLHNFLKRGSGGRGADLLSLVTSNRTRGNGKKLHQGKFRLDIRKRFFTERVVGHWNRLPREAVMAPSLSEFKKHLDEALSPTV